MDIIEIGRKSDRAVGQEHLGIETIFAAFRQETTFKKLYGKKLYLKLLLKRKQTASDKKSAPSL